MISIAAAIHLDVIGIVREFELVFFTKLEAIFCVGQAAVKKFNVARVECGIKFIVAGMSQNHHAALLHHRLVAIHVEEITGSHDLNQNGVQNRVNVVRRYVSNSGNEDVALPFNRNGVLVETMLEDTLVNGFSLSRIAGNHRVVRGELLKHLALGGTRQFF